jgi:RNA-directed DNA polymerase
MKEPYIEGLASHDGPESCTCNGNGAGEALTGVCVGEVLSREIMTSGCRRGSGLGRQHDLMRYRERQAGPARSETLC